MGKNLNCHRRYGKLAGSGGIRWPHDRAGEKDHLVPLKEYDNNRNGMTNARSVTGRIFTAEEHAQNHCQIGNIQLALDVILQWVEEKTSHQD